MSPFSSSQRTRLPFHQRSRMSGLPSPLTSMRTILSSGVLLLSLDLRGEFASCSCTEYFCEPGLVVGSGSEGGRTQTGVVARGAAKARVARTRTASADRCMRGLRLQQAAYD